MPTYEYRCTKGHSFEVTQRINDPPLTKCQVCGRPVQRVMHSPAVHFKGSGFYNTDYGTRKRQREKAASESASTDGGSKSKTDGASTTTSSGGDAKSSSSDGKGSGGNGKGSGSQAKSKSSDG